MRLRRLTVTFSDALLSVIVACAAVGRQVVVVVVGGGDGGIARAGKF